MRLVLSCAVAVIVILASALVLGAVDLGSPGVVQESRGGAAAASESMASELVQALQVDGPLDFLRVRGYRIRSGRVQVVITTEVARTRELVDWLAAADAAHVSTAGALVQADVAVEQLAVLEQHPACLLVSRPDYAELPEPWQGRAEKTTQVHLSEALEAINAEAWHADGFTGEGLKVGVIDPGFGGYEALLGTELPEASMVHLREFGGSSLDEEEVHGTGCAEIVYDVAPGVELYLALISTSVDLANAAQWMADEGVHVATMSVSWFASGPGDGTGFGQEIIEEYVESGGLWCNSAGNRRESHWQGYSTDDDGDGWVEISPDEETITLAYSVSEGDEVRGFISWDDWTTTDQDYSLHLFKIDGEEPVEVAVADRPQSGSPSHQPYESLSYTAAESGDYGFGVFRKAATAINALDFFCLSMDIEHPVEASSVTRPGDSPYSLTVAALGYSEPYGHRDFSSAGPTKGPGGTFEGGSVKADIGGYDGVSTASYGVRGFYGTSAASPHVAGAAAVVMSANPGWTATEVRAFLEESALDKGAIGKDNDYGWGRLTLGQTPLADCTFAASPSTFSFPAVPTSGGWITVTTEPGCYWTAERQVDWIHPTPDSHTGLGFVAFAVDENTAMESRQGSLIIGEQVVTVSQAGAGCTFAISPVAQAFSAAGGDGTVGVSTQDGCSWTAVSNASWMTITAGGSGSGSGTVAFSVDGNTETAPREGTLTVADLTFTVSQEGSTAGPLTYLVAGIAETGGAAGTNWASNLAVCNLSGEAADLLLVYRHGSDSEERQYSLGDRELVEWGKVVSAFFGITGDSGGSVELQAQVPLVVTARTFNDTPDGTYGQFLPGVDSTEGLSHGETGVLSQIKRTDQFRTNVGFVNLGADASRVVIRLYDGSGMQLGTSLSVDVPGYGWQQQNRVFSAAGVDSCSVGYATVEVVSASGRVWAYASVVDNHSGDPTTVPLTVVEAQGKVNDSVQDYLVAGIAATSGTAGTSWKSDLAACNLSGREAEIDLVYRYGDASEARSYVLADQAVVEWANVVSSLFGVIGDSGGSVELRTTAPLIVSARTYNDTPVGTYGQFLPGVQSTTAVNHGETGVLSQIKRTDDFRSNIGFVNFGEQSCTVEIRLYDGQGVQQGTSLTVDVAPGGWQQKNRVFAAAGVDECAVGYAEVMVLTSGGQVWAYASVVDNHSGDPTTVPVSN